jgi:hypothetical protein
MERYKQIIYGTTALIALSMPGENYAYGASNSSNSSYANNVSGNPVSDAVKYMILSPFNEMNKFSRNLSKNQKTNKGPEKKLPAKSNLENNIENSNKIPSRTFVRPPRRFLFRR